MAVPKQSQRTERWRLDPIHHEGTSCTEADFNQGTGCKKEVEDLQAPGPPQVIAVAWSWREGPHKPESSH